jgi:hypothetical protein
MKNRADRNPLLEDLLDDTESLRATSLERGLAVLRQTRRARQRRPAVFAGAAVLLAAALLIANRERPGDAPAKPQPIASIVSPARPDEARIEVISDDELLAQFPDRAVAIVGPADQRQLIFLDVASTPIAARIDNRH